MYAFYHTILTLIIIYGWVCSSIQWRQRSRVNCFVSYNIVVSFRFVSFHRIPCLKTPNDNECMACVLCACVLCSVYAVRYPSKKPGYTDIHSDVRTFALLDSSIYLIERIASIQYCRRASQQPRPINNNRIRYACELWISNISNRTCLHHCRRPWPQHSQNLSIYLMLITMSST